MLAADTVVARRPAHPAQGRDDRRGLELPAAAVRPLAPRLFRRLPDHAGRQAAPAAGRDARALQAAVGRDELESYLASGEWRGKAGGYAIQGLAGTFVVKLVGSYTNVVGLPLYETVGLLTGDGYQVHFNWLSGPRGMSRWPAPGQRHAAAAQTPLPRMRQAVGARDLSVLLDALQECRPQPLAVRRLCHSRPRRRGRGRQARRRRSAARIGTGLRASVTASSPATGRRREQFHRPSSETHGVSSRLFRSRQNPVTGAGQSDFPCYNPPAFREAVAPPVIPVGLLPIREKSPGSSVGRAAD